MAEVFNFTVFTRFPGYRMDMHQPESREYTYLAHASRLTVDLLNTANGRQALLALAMEFDAEHYQTALFRGDRRQAQYYVDLFLSKISQTFPAVLIDQTVTHPDNLGHHQRGEWSGSYEEFDPRMQMISLNASKVYDMIRAGQTEEMAPIFWRFQFLFATTLAHEVGGHLLVTFLSHGKALTPRRIGAPGYFDLEGRLGEAGRKFEIWLFGGTLEYYQAQNQNMHDTGIPHLVDLRGRKFRIHDGFELPMRIAGETTIATRSMGHGIPCPQYDPSVRSMTAGQALDRRMQHLLTGFNVRLRDIYMLPRNPGILLEGY
ncbi:hypothetical protein ASPZODRAFT_166693 [Penicilliopsis zonata CBS 506.65]|uniref:Uncharacterized protein n=1 Tax=Penicilliopsis zonata CBS 506.65 TaxID=1073090 RepID=A0A1L9SGW3_9EURO|nr:hypothetical protein ASPZODRAFT_166693 [Penicilliopsis zonata CBS 506.65]OJJ46421.1 hypothetical protein ASPZODRAFT_166693 [Penicilliopsis zonata CBS 506.65]